MTNPIRRLTELGQKVWLDMLNRKLLSGELKRMINEDGVGGVTSNPKTFSDSISNSQDYDADIRALLQSGKSPEEVYEVLAIQDIQNAADLLRPRYDETGGDDGFVSLEVSPHLAYDTNRTIEQARRFWKVVERPNVFIKVPATEQGVPAIRELISDGINVNVTLLFGLDRYREVAAAYMEGLGARVKAGQPVKNVSSVASFFLSRIDVLADKKLDQLSTTGADAKNLRAQLAVASAKSAYAVYQELRSSGQFRALADKGARPQRLLWASTGAKRPEDSDVKYVEPLIGPETITTLPQKTLDAYRDHGRPEPRLTQGVDEAKQILAGFARVGLEPRAIAQELESQGVKKFSDPYDSLMQHLVQMRTPAHTR